MDTLPENVAREILLKLKQDGYLTEAVARELYDGPPALVEHHLTRLTAEGVAQFTPYTDGVVRYHAYLHLGDLDPVAWDHGKGLDDLKACAARRLATAKLPP